MSPVNRSRLSRAVCPPSGHLLNENESKANETKKIAPSLLQISLLFCIAREQPTRCLCSRHPRTSPFTYHKERNQHRTEKKGTQTMAGAAGLALKYGTEKDRVNCPFYYKTGACRHAEKCTRLHNRPTISQTVMVPHMYLNPLAAPPKDATGRYVALLLLYLQS